ncbi:cytochrome b [Burkholderia cepacia]|uniref:cytochrome b n=1 Tax=Burkholderia cepacia TaxID=292 RepID=UPI00398EDA6F
MILYTMAAGFALHIITDPGLWRFVSTLNMSLASGLIVLFSLRYVWSFFRRTPPDVESVPRGQRAIARLVHSLIYVLVAFVLFSGFVMAPDGYWLFGIVLREDAVQRGAGDRTLVRTPQYRLLYAGLASGGTCERGAQASFRVEERRAEADAVMRFRRIGGGR